MNIQKIKNVFEQEKGKSALLYSQIKKEKIDLKNIKKEIITSKKAGVIIRTVAQETQKVIQFHINKLVTMALKSVFSNPYTFHVEFIQKRNKTECNFFFRRNGYKINPLSDSSGGVLDVAAFALRITMWLLSKNGSSNTLIFDEPFKNINDKTREIHRKIAELMKKLSDKLKIQFIIITMIPEFEDVADKVFELNLKNGVSKINFMI